MGALVDTAVPHEFPVLDRDGLVYLDSGATSQKPRVVIDAIEDFYANHNANIHRGVYPLAQEATDLFEGARERIAAWLGSTPKETLFTKNATEALNLVAYAWGRKNVGAGDAIVLTQMEHHSNLVPWQLLCQEVGAHLRYLEIDGEGRISLDQLDEHLADGRVRLVTAAHVSNVLGTINPVDEIVARARAAGAVSVLDGSQAVPQLPVDVGAIGADFYAWTAHKAYGPTGIGILHGRREVLEAMPPFLGGGDMISSVDFHESRFNELPWKFEAGTSPIAEAVGMGAAVDFLQEIGMEQVRAHELDLVGYALNRLREVPGLTIYGPPEPEGRGALVSFAIDGVHPHDVAEIVARDGVCIRAGHHCAQPLMRKLGVGATSRASFAIHNTREDVDRLIDSLANVRKVFQL
ncbi:MAG: cysteine desulfurase, SufS subfamily [Solirubrobacterales bacterium]|jgi:cysteine desulfurase / selenocysteine lyase|nr:cysteine desulfurase, SufS subfamily [Solirubrobacterales bacterium]